MATNTTYLVVVMIVYCGVSKENKIISHSTLQRVNSDGIEINFILAAGPH